MKKYLYHYTSIDNLLLILKNKTLAFNSLQNVDDLEERDSKDVKQIGKICYVSCWTADSKESIPLWSMYTPNMQGVRIRLEEFPFKKYNFKKGEYYFKNDVDTYIDYAKIFADEKTTVSPDQPRLVEVKYTNDDNLIYPNITSLESEFIIQNNFIVQSKISKRYVFDKLGRYKRKEWDFQKEVRYIINMSLWSMKELENCQSEEDLLKLAGRLESEKYKAPYDLFFLEIREEALSDLEIMLGPKVTDSQKEIVDLIVNKYCPNAKITYSELKIK